MAFTAQHYADLKRLLAEHPEWRRELRQLILPDGFDELPAIVRRLAEAHERAEVRLTRLEEAVERLAEAQQRTDEKVAQLAEAQRRTEERLERLAAAVQELVAQVRDVVAQTGRLTDKVAKLDGRTLELTYQNKAHAYWGFLVRRLKVTPVNALEDQLESALTPGEFRDVFRLDVLASGVPRNKPDAPEIWLAIEVSSAVNVNDVDRAARRAGLLRKAGYRALPVAAGESASRDAQNAARDQNVVLTQDGQVEFWDEALNAWAVS
ncbi:MAG: hypothetical protein HY023_15600 [Chloroflexi bacterium]|nr:hypothetical protein [Chloroflexota bacterium]MBI3762783.1 hypothetical protein [Chloroflexota bacterium]